MFTNSDSSVIQEKVRNAIHGNILAGDTSVTPLDNQLSVLRASPLITCFTCAGLLVQARLLWAVSPKMLRPVLLYGTPVMLLTGISNLFAHDGQLVKYHICVYYMSLCILYVHLSTYRIYLYI